MPFAGPPLATAERRSLLRALENLLLGAPPPAQAEAWYGAAQPAHTTADAQIGPGGLFAGSLPPTIRNFSLFTFLLSSFSVSSLYFSLALRS